MNTSYGSLNSKLTAWENAVQSCGKSLTCVTGQDAKAATYFSAFAGQLQAIALPASAASAGARVEADTTKAAQDFTTLSKTTTASQYQSAITSTGLQQTLNGFNTDYSALNQQLSSLQASF